MTRKSRVALWIALGISVVRWPIQFLWFGLPERPGWISFELTRSAVIWTLIIMAMYWVDHIEDRMRQTEQKVEALALLAEQEIHEQAERFLEHRARLAD